MRAIIFTESSRSIGLGHLRRCEALAEVFCQKNIDVKLVCNSSPRLWDGELSDYDIGVLDSYLEPLESYLLLASHTKKRVVFFDDTLRLSYPPSTILNASLAAPMLGYEQRYPKHQLWLGLGYALLRSPFERPLPKRKYRKNISQILLTFGGSALADEYCENIKSILKTHYKNITIACITPQMNLQASHIKQLMQNSDIAITASGGTLVELAYCAIPSIILCLADNQRPNFDAWMNSRSVYALDSQPQTAEFEQNLCNAIHNLQTVESREDLGNAMQKLLGNSLWGDIIL